MEAFIIILLIVIAILLGIIVSRLNTIQQYMENQTPEQTKALIEIKGLCNSLLCHFDKEYKKEYETAFYNEIRERNEIMEETRRIKQKKTNNVKKTK